MTTTRNHTLEKLWSFSDEHVIDGMIYSNEIDKWITVEEYTDYHYTN
jgi:hypothetical protein